MSSQESLITFIQELKLDDDSKYLEFQKMIEKKISSELKKSKKHDKKNIASEHCRDNVFEQKTKKKDKKTLTKENPSIRVQQENPKTKGSKVWSRYENYKLATTYLEFIEKGGTNDDYNFDLNHNPPYITELSLNQKEIQEPMNPAIEKSESEAEKVQDSKNLVNEESENEAEEVQDSKKAVNEESENEVQEAQEVKKIANKESENSKENKKKTVSKVSKSKEKEMSKEELDIIFKSCLDNCIEEVVSKDNFENKRENISMIKKKIFENEIVKLNFKKTDKTICSLISSKYNEICLVYEKKCKEEFDTITQEDNNQESDEETEEIEVSEISQEGVTYLLDPKSNLVYDSDTNDQIGKYREGIIIFD